MANNGQGSGATIHKGTRWSSSARFITVTPKCGMDACEGVGQSPKVCQRGKRRSSDVHSIASLVNACVHTERLLVGKNGAATARYHLHDNGERFWRNLLVHCHLLYLGRQRLRDHPAGLKPVHTQRQHSGLPGSADSTSWVFPRCLSISAGSAVHHDSGCQPDVGVWSLRWVPGT
jgi:hypothetical protein